MSLPEQLPLTTPRDLVHGALQIVFAYGRRRLAITLLLVICQALSQVIGVASIFWFISVAVSPETFLEHSPIGKTLSYVGLTEVSQSSLILIFGLTTLAIVVISNCLSLAGEYGRTKYAHGLGCWLRDVLLRKIMSNPYGYFLNINSSVLCKKVVQDVMQFVQQIVMPTTEIFTRSLIFLILSCWLVAHQPAIALSSLLLFVVFQLTFIRVIKARSAIISEGINSATRRSYSAVGQIFAGAKPVIVENCREQFVLTHCLPSMELGILVPKSVLIGATAKYCLEVIVYGGLVTWVLFGIQSGRSMEQLMPSVGLFAVAAYRMLPCVQIIAAQITTIQSNAYSLREILEEFESPIDCTKLTFERDRDATRMLFRGEVRLENVSFAYEGSDVQAIHKVSISIVKGKHIGIVGPTGSGKSTLVNLLLGLFTPKSGTILIDNLELEDTNVPNWRATVGYVPQDAFLIDASIAENIAFGVSLNQIDQARVLAAAESAQALQFILNECSNGFDTIVGERGVKLSGGQKQRIAIARALYKRPELLILDEATSALDNVTERLVMDSLNSYSPNLTVISIAHRLSTIENCDCIYYLSGGRLDSSGSYADLLETSIPFQRLVRAI
jgi:ABC-type multidrug transport system fused ATPase/permease subunit